MIDRPRRLALITTLFVFAQLSMHAKRAFADESAGRGVEGSGASTAGGNNPGAAPASGSPAEAEPADLSTPSPDEGAKPEDRDPVAPVVSAPTSAGERDVNVRASLEVAGYQDSYAVSVLTPSLGASIENPTAGWGLSGRYIVDMVSAASPDIVATASPRWTEVRNAGNVGVRYKPGNFGGGIGLTTSYTPDYLALGANGQLVEDLDGKNLTLTQGYGFGHDVIGRTGTSFAAFSRQLDYHSFSLGASRVINPEVVVSLATDFVLERGDQSKPYRYIPIFTPEQAALVQRGESVDVVAAMRIQAKPLEQLPLERERGALTGRLAWRLSSSTVRVEERVYADTWGLRASTTDLRWLFDVGERVILWPHVRFHLQNGVDFWQRAYSARDAHDLPALRTGDLELGPLNNLGLGGGLRLSLGKSGRRDDVVFTSSVDGTRTSYADAIFVKERYRVLVVTALEVAF